MKFEIYVGKDGDHRWRLVAANGENIASGEGYKRREDRDRAVQILTTELSPTTPVIPVNE